MTANDYAALPGGENIGWRYVAALALVAFVVWIALGIRRARKERRDADSLLNLNRPVQSELTEAWALRCTANAGNCGKVLTPGVGHRWYCDECVERMGEDAS